MMMNVFRQSEDGIFHSWAYENLFMPKGDEPNPRQRDRLSNLTSGLLDLCRSVILAFPFNIRFFSTGPLVVDFDEHGANQAFE